MSGDRPAVILAGEADSPIAALVRAAGIVAANAGVPVAVIGGLAVTCRLATASHRATGDVDLVSDDDLDAVTTNGAIAADNLVAAHLASPDPIEQVMDVARDLEPVLQRRQAEPSRREVHLEGTASPAGRSSNHAGWMGISERDQQSIPPRGRRPTAQARQNDGSGCKRARPGCPRMCVHHNAGHRPEVPEWA